jgi:hypothetical protein
LQVLLQLRLGVLAQPAGELRLVNVAEAAEDAGALDDRVGLALQEARAVLLLVAVGERHRLQQQEDVVLAALLADLLDQGELVLGAVRLGRLELGQQPAGGVLLIPDGGGRR